MSMKQNLLSSREARGGIRPRFLAEQRQSKSRLQWWYRFSLFPEPGPTASLEQLEYFRRGQTTSLIILVLTIVQTLPIPVAIFIALFVSRIGLILLAIFIPVITLMLLVARINRSGHVTTAALITVAIYIAGAEAGIASAPIGYTTLPGFHIFLFPLLIAASTLPRRSIPFVTLINIACLILSVVFLPHATGTDMLPQSQYVVQLTAPILTECLVTVIAMLWAGSIARSLKRANRAEEIARLEYDLAQRALQDKEKTSRLEESVQQITEVHSRVANGDLSARVPLTDRNILWQISGLLNNLLTRFQSLRMRYLEQEKTNALLRKENARLLQALNQKTPDFGSFTNNSKAVPNNTASYGSGGLTGRKFSS